MRSSGLSLLKEGGGGIPDDEDGAGDALLAVAELLEEVAFFSVELSLGGVGMAAIVLFVQWLCGLEKDWD